MRKLFVALSIILCSVSLSAQKDSSVFKIPKQISIEAGYRYMLPIIDDANVLGGNSASNGVGILFDYAWQLGGIGGKKPAVFLSIPIGYTMIFADNSTMKQINMLSYGWTIRHELSKNKPVIPFIGYGLFLNNMTEGGRVGSTTGHQTTFEGGVNFNTRTRLKYFAKLQYGYASYPKLDELKRIHVQFLDFRIGARF